MSLNQVDYIRSKSRDEWTKLVRDKWINLRIWIQENGELGFLVAFSCGILFVIFFKFLFGLLVLLALLGFLAWSIAEPEALLSKAKQSPEEIIEATSPKPSIDQNSTSEN